MNQSPVFAGFVAKRVSPGPAWLECPIVEAICSVSSCISEEAPKDYQAWTFNAFGFYDTETLAMTPVPPGEEEDYTLFAYRMVPIQFDETGRHSLHLEQQVNNIPQEPDLSDYKVLGYDLVQDSAGNEGYFSFGCSPLSCNQYAKETQVNRYCLIDDLDTAIALGAMFGHPNSRVEPGPYYLLQVLCKTPL